MADQNQSDTDTLNWESFFGFDEPYENQDDAINAAIQAGHDNGYLVMEGPCGTGKTMAALTAAATLVRSTDQYDNILVVTPVKQQLQQFIDDLRTINQSIDDPLTGVGLVGKPDLCPYDREGAFPPDVSVHSRCEDLRETTAELVESQDQSTLPGSQSTATPQAVLTAARDDTEKWWDPNRALELVQSARINTFNEGPSSALTTAGEESPYPHAQPTTPDSLSGTQTAPNALYCPFEADWYARDKGSPVGFNHGKNHVITINEYLPESVAHGTCPHRVMTVLLEAADIIIGNYNHLFDPQTRPLTERILTDQTFVIIDEAHRLEERVRDLLSNTLGQQTIRRARQDCELLRRYADQDRTSRQQVTANLNEFDVTTDEVTRATQFYIDLLDWLDQRIDTELDRDPTPLTELTTADEPIEIPLRDPTTSQTDELTEWAHSTGYDKPFWESIATIGLAVEQALDTIQPERSCVTTAVGALLQSWYDSDHATYFREIELDPSTTHDQPETWEDAFTPRLVMYNCLPSYALASIFDTLGGGILMSATLEPLDIFKQVTGLAMLATEPNPRPIIDRTYDLSFPPENRATWVVDATPYTAKHRGDPTEDTTNDTRMEYTQILTDIARSPGNVMLCLPNYSEAAWTATQLRSTIDKPVLVDESSSAEETTDLKHEFFDSQGAVLVTSTRGTLTEGIDYDHDKLHTCAVIGIPLVNIGSPRVQAVKHAYGTMFGDEHAFEYALTIPAVRRARQAIGRVIRSPTETGVRILIDHRYTNTSSYGSVYEYFPQPTQDEMVRMTPMFLQSQITEFWQTH